MGAQVRRSLGEITNGQKKGICSVRPYSPMFGGTVQHRPELRKSNGVTVRTAL